MLIISYVHMYIICEFKPDPMTHEETKEKTSEKQEKPTPAHTLIYARIRIQAGIHQTKFNKTHSNANTQICRKESKPGKNGLDLMLRLNSIELFLNVSEFRGIHSNSNIIYTVAAILSFSFDGWLKCVHDAYTFYSLNDLCYCWIRLPLLLVPVVYHHICAK